MIVAVVSVSLWVAVGAVVGAVYFAALLWSVRRVLMRPSALSTAAAQIARFAILGVALGVVATRFGSVPLLASNAGIFLGRAVLLRYARVT
jgi:N-ATPase, AtpR subunit